MKNGTRFLGIFADSRRSAHKHIRTMDAIRRGRRYVLPLMVSLGVIGSACETTTVPTDNAVYTANTTLAPGLYVLPHGIAVGASNVTLNCNGATLQGNFGPGMLPIYGVTTLGNSNVTIKNCRIKGYYYGLRAENGSGIQILDNDLSNNWKDPAAEGAAPPFLDINVGPDALGSNTTDLGGGLFVRNASAASIQRNTLVGQNNGMDLYDVTDSTVDGNDASNNVGWGIHLYRSKNNSITDNHADHCLRGGGLDSAGMLLVWESDDNVIVGNSFQWSGDGFFIGNENGLPSNGNLVQSNDGSYSSNNAFEATFSAGNQFIDNDASFSNYGFWLGYSHSDTVVKGNRVIGNAQSGIEIDQGVSNQIEDNVIMQNGGTGLVLRTDNVVHFPAASFPELDLPSQPSSAFYLVSGNVVTFNGKGMDLVNTSGSLLTNNAVHSNTNGNATSNNAFNFWSVSPTDGTNIMGGATLGGNYWGDYGGTDLDGDGLGDTPYTCGGAIAGPGDSHPIVSEVSLCEPLSCGGDCDGDGSVTVDELVLAVNVALGNDDLSACAAADFSGDGAVTVNELVRSVNHALEGCSCSASSGSSCACAPVIPNAPGSVVLDIGEASADPGAATAIPIVLDGDPMAALQIDLVYPSTIVGSLACTASSASHSAEVSFPASPPVQAGMTRARVLIYSSSDTSALLAVGTVASCSLVVDAGAPAGTYLFQGEDAHACGTIGDPADAVILPGSVKITAP